MGNPIEYLSQDASALALRFISGKYQGTDFPLDGKDSVVLGRAAEVELVLLEDMVSRKHARITRDGGQLYIEDLGSTNGTFVNGERIKRTTLTEGDRVLIGTSIMKVVVADEGRDGDIPAPTPSGGASGRSGQTRSMSGSIDEIPLPDLLQLFGSSRKSGILVVSTDDLVGRIHLRKGIVHFASVTEAQPSKRRSEPPSVGPLKAAYRILGWTHGTFDLEPPDDTERDGEIEASVQELLMEGLRQLDELNHLRAGLPPMGALLTLSKPLAAPLRDLSHGELDFVQLFLDAPGPLTTRALLDKSPLLDLDAVQILSRLLSVGYVRSE